MSIMHLLFRLITFCARNLMSVSRNHIQRAWWSRLFSSDGKDFKASMTKEQWLKQRKVSDWLCQGPFMLLVKTAGILHRWYTLNN